MLVSLNEDKAKLAASEKENKLHGITNKNYDEISDYYKTLGWRLHHHYNGYTEFPTLEAIPKDGERFTNDVPGFAIGDFSDEGLERQKARAINEFGAVIENCKKTIEQCEYVLSNIDKIKDSKYISNLIVNQQCCEERFSDYLERKGW